MITPTAIFKFFGLIVTFTACYQYGKVKGHELTYLRANVGMWKNCERAGAHEFTAKTKTHGTFTVLLKCSTLKVK